MKQPFGDLLDAIAQTLGPNHATSGLARIDISRDKLCRPVRPSNRAAELGPIKSFAHFTLWEKKSSLFEWNPGIHFQLGTKPDDCILGVGLYMISGRQLSRLRAALTSDTKTIRRIMNGKRFSETWGGLLGERYKRFPKGYSPDQAGAEFLWYKQFYVGKQYTRRQVTQRNFIPSVISDLAIAMPYFAWVRAAVGTYSERSRIDRDS